MQLAGCTRLPSSPRQYCASLCAEQEAFYGKEIIVADREMVEMVGGPSDAHMHCSAVQRSDNLR